MPTIIKTLKDMFGNQIIPRTKTNAVALSDGSLLNTYEDYIRGGGGIKPQIVVTAPAGAVITCTDGTVTFTGVSTGTYTFYLPHFGTYTVSSVLEYQTSPIQTVVVDTVTIYRVTLIHFSASIQVTAPAGSSLICKSGATTLTGTSTGIYTFSIKTPGTWIISATLNNKTVQKVVEVSDAPNQTYPITLNYYAVYGVRINTTSSNPLSSVSYIEGTEAFGMTKGSSDWDSKPLFNSIKPCLMANGEVTTYLNPNNYAQNTSGTALDITSNSSRDVMVEFGKGGYKFVKNGNYIDIYVTDDPDASSEGYVYHPFSYAAEGDCNHFWWGAYLGWLDSGNRLRSVSGTPVSSENSYIILRGTVQAKGAGYSLTSYFQLLWIQILYLLKYGNLNSQAALGGGYTSATSQAVTGATNTYGLNYGKPSVYNDRLKLFGIEDFYGNCSYFIRGAFYASDTVMKLTYPGYSSSENDYKFTLTIGASSNTSEFTIQTVQGTNELGFIAKDMSSTVTGYYSDKSILLPGRVPNFGGAYNSSESAGIFSLPFNMYDTTTNPAVAGRISYCYTGK